MLALVIRIRGNSLITKAAIIRGNYDKELSNNVKVLISTTEAKASIKGVET